MTIELTPDTLTAFIEGTFATKQYPTVPYFLNIIMCDQLEVGLGIAVANSHCEYIVAKWVQTFGKNYQFHLCQEILDGRLIITGFTFWVENLTGWDDALGTRYRL